MRIAALGVLAGLGLAVASLPAAAQTTTRIESRPFYGAVVTMEEGVRVFRPLPPHDRIIINPDKVPLSLAFTQSYNYSYAQNFSLDAGNGGSGPRYAYSFIPGGHMRRHRGHHMVSGKR
jgi:hypothetical protein